MTTATEALVGKTTRPVTFTDKGEAIRLGSVSFGHRRPAGTQVYVTCPRRGMFRIRIPGTLLEQDVSLGTVEPV